MKTKTKLIVLGASLSLAAFIAWPFMRSRHLEHSFDEIHDGEGKDIVLSQMGKPWKDESCGEFLGGNPPGCVEDLIYAHPFAPYIPEYWIVYLDREHHVISHYYTTSP
jgi:hypothetical protein